MIRRILERVRVKKNWRDNIFYPLLQGLWLHTQLEDGATIIPLRPIKNKRRSYNDAI